MAAGYRAGEGVIARTVGGRRVDIGAVGREILNDFQVAQESCECDDRKSEGRE